MALSTSNRAAPSSYLSLGEVAAELGITDRTVRNYVARGVLPAHRIKGSRLIRVRRSDVDALLQPVPVTDGGDAA
ncbi:putative phage excisionase [Nostocoides japonicum T1-X7]|uniref:Putative phage excisionase n=1 Tax=Nostocoides japonicum T1-X7 TaxID=1194083 RepID=A0A077LVM6_9MICO|nr:helix-turn-helix domain-containing protein [Tetrasphaera japonica]CCH77731.1 putative phage excisionase [Tetrasphaera japonica T1-X7]